MEKDAILLLGPVLDVVGHAGQRVVDDRLVFLVILVKPVGLRAVGFVAHPKHLAGLVGHDRRPGRHVKLRMREDHPAQFPLLEVELEQCLLVSIGSGHVEDVWVLSKTQRDDGCAKVTGINLLPIRLGIPPMKDGPSEAVLGNPDADDFITVSDELQNVTPIEDNPFFLCCECIEPDDIPVESTILTKSPTAFAHLD